MYLIRHTRQDRSGNLLQEEILPDIFMTTEQCAVLMERMSSKFDISDYCIYSDRWWGRAAKDFNDIHFWHSAPVDEILRREN